ncbi:MAG TPA: flagellar motor switch protein FliN [Bryobacteraceae bacterium]|nr:flagellar motor switch protein FliN [Bryobacteraceae bacterium]
MAASSDDMFAALVEVWKGQFGEAWEAMAGSRPETNVQEAVPAPEPGQPQPVWYRFDLGQGPGASFFVGSQQWANIGAFILAAAGVDAPSPEDIQGTCAEMLNQAASGLARALSKQAGREILAASGVEGPPPPEDAVYTSIRFRIEDSDQELLLAGSESLVNLLLSFSAGAKPEPTPPTALGAERGRSMDLLLDVELPVSVSFGRAQLPLKDVLKLTTGSIVELNRSVSEPVEVIVNNCVIARGEVVVVEGNFGVRIRQVVSRQERLQSLK